MKTEAEVQERIIAIDADIESLYREIDLSNRETYNDMCASRIAALRAMKSILKWVLHTPE